MTHPEQRNKHQKMARIYRILHHTSTLRISDLASHPISQTVGLQSSSHKNSRPEPVPPPSHCYNGFGIHSTASGHRSTRAQAIEVLTHQVDVVDGESCRGVEVLFA